MWAHPKNFELYEEVYISYGIIEIFIDIERNRGKN